MYVLIYYKTKNAEEIQYTACVVSSIIIRLNIVKIFQYSGHNDGGDDLIHGIKTLF